MLFVVQDTVPGKLWGYDLNHPMYIRLKKGIKNYLIKLVNKYGEVEVISGMALGFDTILAQATLELKDSGYNIHLHCAIPCKNHCSGWVHESIEEWNRIIWLADKVTYVSKENYTKDCMQKRNIFMVDNSNELLALWDGSSGGTANCVKYAEFKGLKITKLFKEDK